ncbi:MAG: AAA family ATPase [Actinomycetota bacterium]|nr:AAA family ATPase [Actinomycetota bacterium]
MPRISGWSHPLPHVPQRVLVTGASGSGKPTVAARVATVLGLPHTEIDGLYHGRGWVPRESFLDDVRALVAGPRWVVEWQYGVARPLLLARADTLVWLDLPRRVVLARVVLRTVRRRLRRIELWNGNLEPPLWTFFTERDHIVRWSWRTHPAVARRVHAALSREHGDRVHVVRLRSRREVAAWVEGPLSTVARR